MMMISQMGTPNSHRPKARNMIALLSLNSA